jgi:hypothetical protein
MSDLERRIQRARLAVAGTAVTGAMAAVAVFAAQAGAPVGGRGRPAAAKSCSFSTDAAALAQARSPARIRTGLKRPGALAVGPRGQLYIADDGLDEILQALPGGRFLVVAGTGRPGYSGDGGPAVRASLNDPGGLAVTPGGTIFVADTGNNRVRAISPSGTITTVAGDGRYGGWVAGGIPARRASLAGPADVAVGPGGCPYIADQGGGEILRLAAAGRVVRVAGVRGAAGVPGAGQAATRASADGPDGLAFGATGDLFVAGSFTKTLLMVTARGRMRLPAGTGTFYPRGVGGLAALSANLAVVPGGLAEVPGHRGTGVLAINGQRVQWASGQGLTTLFDLSRERPAGIRGFLTDGLAVSAQGAIYLDTYAGNGYASATALIEIGRSGGVRVIWQG